MSLVDYAASSDEEDEEEPIVDADKDEPHTEDSVKRQRVGCAEASQPSLAPPEDNPVPACQRTPVNSTTILEKTAIVPDQSSSVTLPDASALLNSPLLQSNPLKFPYHSSRVAAAVAESASRKRDLNVPPAYLPHRKISRGLLPHLKSVPDTVGSRLLPPQLAGRSNVVTEDISKLFVRKHTDSSA